MLGWSPGWQSRHGSPDQGGKFDGNKEATVAVGMHNMRLGRSLASLIGEAEGSGDALKAGHFNPRRNFSILDSVDSGDVSLGSYYEDTLRKMLTVVWPQKLLVLATIAAALVIGIALALVMPKRYTAEAYVGGGFADAATLYESAAAEGSSPWTLQCWSRHDRACCNHNN